MRVFFYGLFMDETLLAGKGIQPSLVAEGFVDGFRLYVGERATLLRDPNARVYGVMMEITAAEASALYAEQSVSDYLPEPVTVELPDGTRHGATCYNLPGATVSAANRGYANALLALATRLGFPESYLEQIRQALA